MMGQGFIMQMLKALWRNKYLLKNNTNSIQNIQDWQQNTFGVLQPVCIGVLPA